MEGGSGRLGMGGEDEVGQTQGSQEQMSQQGATHGRQEDRYDSEERPNEYGNIIVRKEACWLNIF